MGDRQATVVVVVVIGLVNFLPLAPAAQASTSEQPQTDHQSFDELLETEKRETHEEMNLLNQTRQALLHVAQLIRRPEADSKLESDANTSPRDACLLEEAVDTSPEDVAVAFEVFATQLDPSGSAVTLNESLHQIRCFARAQAKVAPGSVTVKDEALPPRQDVTRYIQALSERLDAHQRHLHLLEYRFPAPTPPSKHLSGSLLAETFGAMGADKKISTKIPTEERHTKTEEELSRNLIHATYHLAELVARVLRVELEAAAVQTAVIDVKTAKTLLENLRQDVRSATPPTKDLGSTLVWNDPYCQGVTYKNTINNFSKDVMTGVSETIGRLRNAAGATDIRAAREELQCRMSKANTIIRSAAKRVANAAKNMMVRDIEKVLEELMNVIVKLEDKAQHFPANIQELTAQKSALENSVQEATATYLHQHQHQHQHHHHHTGTPPHSIHKKVDAFHEFEMDTGCCH